jgi:hypothetical protein
MGPFLKNSRNFPVFRQNGDAGESVGADGQCRTSGPQHRLRPLVCRSRPPVQHGARCGLLAVHGPNGREVRRPDHLARHC